MTLIYVIPNYITGIDVFNNVISKCNNIFLYRYTFKNAISQY